MSFDIDRIADRIISEAIEQGKFDDLEGKGRPLNLEEDPLTPPHLRLSNRVLMNASVRPDWVQVEVEIRESRAECERLWSRAEREYDRRQREISAARGESERTRRAASFTVWYARSRRAYERALRRVNDFILKHNLMAPNSPAVMIPFRLNEELHRFEAAFPPPEGWESVPVEAGDARRGLLRDSAAGLYRNLLRGERE